MTIPKNLIHHKCKKKKDMAKFILLLTGITLMYLAISGKLLNIIPIRDPLAELFICLLGLICVVLSVIYFKYKN